MKLPLGFLACALTLALAAAAPAATDEKPNIVVLVSDDCGYNEFSMQGAKLYPTPNIDSIAKHGVRFTNGYVSGCVCSPTRAGLLTGRYQQRFGHEFNIPPVYSESNGLPISETLLPAVLDTAGYRTIALGKWHLGYAPQFHPLSRGFTDYYGFLKGSRSYFPLKKADRLSQLLRDREPVKENFDYLTDELGRQAAAYVASNKDHPFFMYVAFNATHAPHETLASDLKSVEGEGGDRNLRAMTIAMDRAVGIVIDALKKQNVYDNTLLFFINDNGGPKGHDNAPLRGNKGSLWEGGIRVPMAAQWPGKLPAGRVYDAPVISLDIFPTAMAAAGLNKTPGKSLDGVNLLPYLTGAVTGPPHETLYWRAGSQWAVRHGDLKLVKIGEVQPQLFNLAADIAEQHDLASERGDEAKKLLALHTEWNKQLVAPIQWTGQLQKGKKNGTPTAPMDTE